eukprot:CAMPEP_0168752356 /NCGR_PEP_ID=MMETSP0724-20121128/18341_1 /TAXON_ID=265536 /ORGANISM="Amphiprora sp., Strain CCMP467" /LENGTH=68 /DNA_ID=CAMNT_0008800597 /DNA_START=21 /DNA_END=224 /DNA_ORIENTATION=+
MPKARKNRQRQQQQDDELHQQHEKGRQTNISKFFVSCNPSTSIRRRSENAPSTSATLTHNNHQRGQNP